MLETLHKWLDRRRESRISKNFESAIALYRREILVPLALDFPPEADLLQRRKNRVVYRDAARVWKFYRASQRGFARNFRSAAALLEARQIAAPMILHADTSKASKEKFGISLLLMERIEGVPVATSSTDKILDDLGRFLALIHGLKSPFWGDCIRQRGSPFAAEYFVNSLEAEMLPINEWLRGMGEPALAPPGAAWNEAASRIRPNADQFSLICGDAHPGNFIRRPNGSLCVIDLDRAQYLDFPAELIYFLLRVHDANPKIGLLPPEGVIELFEDSSRPFLSGYFNGLPESARRHWDLTKLYYLRRGLIWDLWNTLKSVNPTYNAYLKKDEKQQNEKARRLLAVLRQFERGG